MVTHASILAWEIPGTLARHATLSTGSQKKRQDFVTNNKGQTGQHSPSRGEMLLPASLGGEVSSQNMRIYATHLLFITSQEMT